MKCINFLVLLRVAHKEFLEITWCIIHNWFTDVSKYKYEFTILLMYIHISENRKFISDSNMEN